MTASERIASKSLGRRVEVYLGLAVELAQLAMESYFVTSPKPEVPHRGPLYCTCVLGVLMYVAAVVYMRTVPIPIFFAINSEAERFAAEEADRKHMNRVRGMCCLSFAVIVLGATWQMFIYLEALSVELLFPLFVFLCGLVSLTCTCVLRIRCRPIIAKKSRIDV